MDPLDIEKRHVYSKEQLIAIRDAYLHNADFARFPVKRCAISIVNPSSKSLRKPRSLKVEDGTMIHPPEEAPAVSTGDTPLTPLPQEPQSLWRRSAGVLTSADMGSRYTYVRHSSGSSGGDEGTMASGSKEGADWTLGCGKWRHRSKSGSERGNKTFFSSGSRGRGRGDGIDNSSFSSSRGRGFVRRPYRQFSTRGRSYKSFNEQTPTDHPEGFWNNDDWKDGHGAGSPNDSYLHQRHEQGDASSHGFVPFTQSGSKPETDFNKMGPQKDLARPPGIALSPISPRPQGDVSFMSAFPQQYQTGHSTQDESGNQIVTANQHASVLWYYLDSAGIAQGPYSNATMTNWFTTGHFPISVEVRRQFDKVFYRLTDFITWMNRFPFVNSHQLPPILEPRQVPTSSVSVPPSPIVVPTSVSPPTSSPGVSKLASASSDVPQANANLVDLNLLTEATMNEVIRLQQDAKRLMERASVLGADHAKLIGNFAALGMANNQTIDVSGPPQVTEKAESAVAQIAALAAAVSVSAEHQPNTTEQRPPVVKHELKQSTSPNKLEEQAVPSKKKQKKRVTKTPTEKQPTELAEIDSAIQSPEKVVSAQLPATVKLTPMIPNMVVTQDSCSVQQLTGNTKTKLPFKLEETSQSLINVSKPIITVQSRNKTKLQKKKIKSVSETEEEKQSFEQESTPIVQDDVEWDTISDPVYEAFPPYQTAQMQEFETVSSKKPKKKKKGKLTAADKVQQAWEQEEERRRRQVIAKEAEAQRVTEEERRSKLGALAEAKKAEIVAQKAILAARHREEAKRKEDNLLLANLKLPSTAKWGAQSNLKAVGHNDPAPLVDILAAERQEQEFAKAQGGGGVTFAQKFGSQRSQPLEGKNAITKEANLPMASSPHLVTAIATKQQRQHQISQKAPADNHSISNTNKTTQQVMPSKQQKIIKPSIKTGSSTGVSIWDLPSNPSSVTVPSKKNKKKKANSSCQLLTGSMISLQPNARTDLVKWCENQLSGFPRQNVDLPTLIALLCDIEEAEDIRLCIEASFGKSPLVSKFSKAFVEKRALLLRSSA